MAAANAVEPVGRSGAIGTYTVLWLFLKARHARIQPRPAPGSLSNAGSRSCSVALGSGCWRGLSGLLTPLVDAIQQCKARRRMNEALETAAMQVGSGEPGDAGPQGRLGETALQCLQSFSCGTQEKVSTHWNDHNCTVPFC